MSTGTTGAVTAGGEGVVGMGDEVGQTILVRMNVLEQAHTQSQLNHSASISKLRSYTPSQFRVLNNNISAFGGTIQGSLVLVRQRTSNRGVLLSGTGTPQSQLQLLVETTLQHSTVTLVPFNVSGTNTNLGLMAGSQQNISLQLRRMLTNE